MNRDIVDDITEAYIERYGIEKSVIVLIEELSELQQALCKYLRHSENAIIRKNKAEIIHDIRAEMTDVLYCMRYACNITGNTWNSFMDMAADKAIENRNRLEDKKIETNHTER